MNSRGSETGLVANNDLSGIYQGILNDDVQMLHESMDNNVNINLCFRGASGLQHIGMTPLALAAALNKMEALKFLLRYGANINDTFASLRTTALMTSAFHGHVKVVETLLSHGANVQAIDLQGSTALGYAFGGSRSLEVIELLIKSGININQKNMLGMNALLLVAGYGDDRLVRMVLSSQADPNTVNDFGHSALHLVIVGKRSQLKKLVQDSSTGVSGKLTLDNFNNLKSAEVAIKDWAARHKELHTDSKRLEKAANLMSNIGTKVQNTFVKTVEDNEQEVIKQRVEAVWLYRQEKLLASKKLLKKSGKLESLLGCRGKKDRDDDIRARPYLSVPSRLSNKLNTEKDKEISDLKEKFASILMMIAKAGCDVALTEKTFGMTALDMAILLEDVESTGHLIAMGADPEHLLKMFALSDLHESIISGDKRLVEKLISYDSDLDLNHYFSAFNVELNTANGEEVKEGLVSEGLTPLCVAVQMPEEEGATAKIAKILIKNRADYDKVGPGGSFPLAEAARTGNLRMCQLLVAHGAEVDQISPRYNNATPFLVAALFNRSDVAQFLSDRHAMMDYETTDGKCALTEAYRNDNLRLIETVMRCSLASAFKDRLSFTYEMVAKYQRPDKNMNMIMKLIGQQVKKVNGIKSDVKPKTTRSSEGIIEKKENDNVDKSVSRNSSRQLKANEEMTKRTSSKKVSKSTSDFPSFVEQINEERIEKSVGRTLEQGVGRTLEQGVGRTLEQGAEEFEKLKQDASSKVDGAVKDKVKPFVNKLAGNFEKETNAFLIGSKEFIQQNNKKIERDFHEVKDEIQDHSSRTITSLRDGTRSKVSKCLTDVQQDIRRSAESPMIALIDQAERASEILKNSKDQTTSKQTFDNPETEYISAFKPSENRLSKIHQYSEESMAQNYSENGSREEEEGDEEEEWENDKDFREHYYPANTYDSSQEPCMMTTPILGRCSQVRNNFAQADNYLKDVVSAGKSKRPNVYSAIRSIEPEGSEEEDEVQVGNVRISADFHSLASKSQQKPNNS